MIQGEPVIVRTMSEHGVDPGGDPLFEPDEPQTVTDVLADFDSEDDMADMRADGIRVDCTLRFPRSWEYRSLRDAIITVRGHDYRVVGDPKPIDGGITPTRWNLSVDVTDTKG